MKNLSKKQLLEIIQEQAAQLKKRDEQIETLQAALERERVENTLLRRKVDLLVRRVFGPSSEKLDPAQIEFLLMGEETSSGKVDGSWNEEAEAQPSRRRASPGTLAGRPARGRAGD